MSSAFEVGVLGGFIGFGEAAGLVEGKTGTIADGGGGLGSGGILIRFFGGSGTIGTSDGTFPRFRTCLSFCNSAANTSKRCKNSSSSSFMFGAAV